MRIIIMVRNPLFQNWERRFQMFQLKIRCHLKRHKKSQCRHADSMGLEEEQRTFYL